MMGGQAERGDTTSLMERKVCESIVDERADPGYVLKRFTCDDPGYSEPKGRHHHAYNIDLKYPGIPIPKIIFLHHRGTGYTCTSKFCPWKENNHIHLTGKD